MKRISGSHHFISSLIQLTALPLRECRLVFCSVSRRFLLDIGKLSRTPFLQDHLETPDSVFMKHICDYNIIKLNVN